MKKIYLLFLMGLLFLGQSVQSQCTFTSSFGTATINPTGALVTISTCSFAGEYSTINGAAAGQNLTFTSSVSTDFITVHSGTPNGPVIGFGQTPLSIANTFTGTVYAHWSTNAACGTQSSCRTTTVQCTNCTLPPPSNDLCSGAITLNCGQTIAGSTVAATIDNVPTCVTTLNTAPGVWYTFVGNGVQNILSLCGSSYDTKIGVFTGTCASLTCVTGNDDFCGLQSQVTFTPVNGTTYYVLVTGFGTASGSFTLNRSCAAPLNDLCSGALPIACNATVTGSTVGATPDVVPTCVTTLSSAPGVWYTFTGDGTPTTLSLCGSAYDTKIGVFSGSCAAPVCVTGNDDFCGLQSQVTFTTVNGTVYYVLVTGFGTASGAFTLARTCLAPCTITRTSAPGTDNQVLCANTPLVNITYATTVASGATFTGLPAGVTGTWANNVVTISGTPTVSGVFNYTVTLVGCAAATTVSGIITVNANENLIIVADPGTTLCEGDPTLLTVYNSGGSTPPGNLYTQSGAPTVGINSQKFEAANAAFDNQGADDFTVPAGASWTVTNVNVTGVYYNGTGPATSLNVYFYSNSTSNLPGAAIATFTNVTTFTGGPNFNITLPTAVVLPAGTYWVSVQVNMAFSAGGQWGWNSYGTTNVGFERAWQNPPGGFATPCNAWGYAATGCGVGTNRNHVFTIVGTSVMPGGVATGTFLWSPAAGLSSTTSNPVAASPMNTTTYTVTRTTAQGCQNSASITITVNKRPKVTTQPVAAVACAGSSASFTVAGTGTALTYQWQERTTPTGAWNNLTNVAPYSGVNTATLTINPTTGVMNGYAYRCVLGGTCAPGSPAENVSNAAILTVNPLPVVAITPAIACGGVAGINGTQLSVGSAPPPVPGSVSASSGPVSIVVPDGTGVAATADLTIAGIPANATLTEVKVTFNMTHTWVGDMDVNIKAPNAAILNLVGGLNNGTGNNGTANFTNTAFSSLGGATISGAPAPRTGTFAAEARTGYGPTGYLQPAGATWAALTPTASAANGTWRLAMGDWGPGDVGTLTSWSIVVNYTTPGTGGGPTLSYVWSPLAGLYNNATATSAYTGTNTPTVYAAPTQFTIYTVTATNVATGCANTATAQVNYTPPAPNITPSSVSMCLGDAAVRLVAGTSAPANTGTICSPTVNVEIPDGNATPTLSNINVTTVPAGAIVTGIDVTLNIKNHTYPADLIINLKAPNGQILSLYKHNGNTNNGAASVPGAGFYNAVVSSAGSVAFTAVPTPFRYGVTAPTGPFRADALNGVTNPGYPIMDPAGYVSNATNFSSLYSTPNGTWTLAMADGGAGDVGTFTGWCIKINYLVGVPSTPAVWSPIAGLFNDAAATIPYTGTPRDTVWTRPTPAGVYNYQATVQSVPYYLPASFSNTSLITINDGTATPYPANLNVSGLPATGVSVKSVTITGINHTWSEDVDILLQSPSGQNVILISDVGGLGNPFTNNTYTLDDSAPTTMSGTATPPSGTYKPTNLVGIFGPEPDIWPAPGPGVVNQPNPTLSTFTGNMNGTWKLFVYDDAAGDQGTITGGFTITFNTPVAPCTSAPRTVVVTVNQPTTVTLQPVSQTICTDKVATFTVAGGGSGPFSYQWQVSTDGGNNYSNIANGGVYSGATSATLTITAPPVSMNNNFYRCVVTGAAPCASATSNQAKLTVNPLPTVLISGSPNNSTVVSLFPGLRTTLSSTVSPFAAATYTWMRDGIAVSGANASTLGVDVDGLGVYQLRVTDINGCTNMSNTVTVKDSASARCFIYPNPNSGQFQVRYYSVANNVLPRTLTVYSATGQKVFSKYYTVGRPYDRMDVDMRPYGKGVYTVEIGDLNGNRITVCKVVIQ